MDDAGADAEPALAAWAREETVGALGDGVRPGPVGVLQRRQGALVLRVHVQGGPVVLRLTRTDVARGDDERTAAVVRLVRASGVPAPAVLATAPAMRAGWRTSVEELVPGVPWAQVHGGLGRPAVKRVHEDLAAAVLALQAVRLAGFGELDRWARPAGVPLLDAIHGRIEQRVPPGAAQATARRLVAQEATLFRRDERPVLTHDDLHAANVLVRRTTTGWRLAALLDWEKVWAGPADADVARLALWDGMTGPGFWSVYRSAVPARDGDARRALVLQLLWCLEHDWPTPRHRADTSRLRAALGV